MKIKVAHYPENGSSYQEAQRFNNADIYHVAIRVKREELIQT